MSDYNKASKSIQRFVPHIPCLLVTLLLASILFGLSAWQWHRAQWKEGLLDRMQQAKQSPAKQAVLWLDATSSALTRLHLEGRLDPSHQVWLQSMHDHRLGYDVWVPFLPTQQGARWVWVDWGWIAAHGLHAKVQALSLPREVGSWEGLVVALPRSNVPGIHAMDHVQRWPVVGVAVNWSVLEKHLDRRFTLMAWRLLPPAPKGWVRDHPVVTVSPVRHRAYALQWFLLGLAALWVGYRLQCQRRYQ